MRALAACLALLGGVAGADDPVRLRVDRTTTHQTWEAWSCVPNPVGFENAFVAWLRAPTAETYDRVGMNHALPKNLISRMHDALVKDMGITRVRIEVGPQVEQTNDNDDPFRADAKAFRFAWQDDQVERHLLPLKERIEAAGDRMVVYVSYDLRSKLTPAFLLEPEEYAEMAVVFLAHIRERYGIEPDYWSVLNEPGNDRPGDPRTCAELTAAAGRRIADAGFRTRMSGPECVNVAQADRYLKAMAESPASLEHFRQITYHLYHGSAQNAAARRAVRDWARKLNITAAQTEWMEGTGLDVARHILLCLTEADAVAWDRFGADGFFTFPYRVWLDPKSDAMPLSLNATAHHIRQFSRYIRPGAVRVGLEGGSESVRGVAFLPKDKETPVVVLLNTADRKAAAEIDGLPEGAYGGSFTSEPEKAYGREIPALRVTKSGRLAIALPPRSVTTLTP